MTMVGAKHVDLTSAVSGVSRAFEPRDKRAGSGAGGHVGGQGIVRRAVQILAGTVIPHRGARVGVTGSDLHITQIDTRV